MLRQDAAVEYGWNQSSLPVHAAVQGQGNIEPALPEQSDVQSENLQIDDELAVVMHIDLQLQEFEHDSMPSGLTVKDVAAAVQEWLFQEDVAAQWPVTIEELQEAVMIQLHVPPENAPACAALQAVVQALGASAGPRFVSMSSSPDLTSTSQAESSVAETCLVPVALTLPREPCNNQADDPGMLRGSPAASGKNRTECIRTKLMHIRAVWPNWPDTKTQTMNPYTYEKEQKLTRQLLQRWSAAGKRDKWASWPARWFECCEPKNNMRKIDVHCNLSKVWN